MRISNFKSFLLSVVFLPAVFLLSLPAQGQGIEEWRYGITIRPGFVKNIKKRVIASYKKKNKKKKLSKKAVDIQVEAKLNTLLQLNGLKILYKVDADTYQLQSVTQASKPDFANEFVPLTHNAYIPDEKTEVRTSPVSGVSALSVTACPSVPDSTECNGFTNDPTGSWALSPTTGMAVNEAWKKSTGSNVIVAILSTGTKLDHPDLAANLWRDTAGSFAPGESLHGFNAYANSPPTDSSGTGTALAGIVAAKANNSIGLPGIAYDSRLMIVKAFDEVTLDKPKVIASFNYVLKKKREGHNIRVVLAPNFYFGFSPGLDPAFQSIAQELNSLGVLIVANVSRFNNDPNLNIDGSYNGFKYFPLHFNTGNILLTSSYKHGDFNNTLPAPVYSSSQNVGPNTIHVSAPGEYIYTTDDNGGYIYYHGGSMSSANAAGVAALLFSKVPASSPSQIVAAIRDNTRLYPASFAGKTISQGALDAGKAMQAVSPTPQNNGDYDGNGCVNGSDFLLWQRTFGATVPPGTSADGNGDGKIDAADYTVWRDNYGAGC